MRYGGSNGGEAEPITECEEYAEVDFAMLIVRILIKLKLSVDN
jgi:hypothetical protein